MIQQNGPLGSTHSSLLDYLSSVDIAQQLLIFHTQLLEATDDIELIIQVTYAASHLFIFWKNEKKLSNFYNFLQNC